ncbi:type II toxin-antitoxin system HicA family toxin [Oscillatoria amoena NRMC-F 0135]|nr:type II toxin-antitoxin system HicA family toxin [Oscillatoria laete-virens]MDL5050599.1 type II toxin-antitoxin system HicA family toxin [Oscillatoria amoena NRMC-F 0135]MDL5055613.1 type II toxin-antitoxin system HicA family toxin [Oscillatoria laete-virens NRMC-F 0139]
MPRLPRLKGKELIQILKTHGFEHVRTRGSHFSMRHPDGRYTVIPIHAGETIGTGLLLKIMKDAEISKDDLLQ